VSEIHDRCLALAGICQASAEVRRIGRDGNAGTHALNTTLRSLFVFDSDTVANVYGGARALEGGLRALRNLLTQQRDRSSAEITRYALSLVALERKVSGTSGVLEAIHWELLELVESELHQPPFQPAALHRIADIYLRHVSRAGPRIMVQGEPSYLKADGNPERIRALLLGGLRSVVLWRQLGGSRLSLMLGRRALTTATDQILATITVEAQHTRQ